MAGLLRLTKANPSQGGDAKPSAQGEVTVGGRAAAKRQSGLFAFDSSCTDRLGVRIWATATEMICSPRLTAQSQENAERISP